MEGKENRVLSIILYIVDWRLCYSFTSHSHVVIYIFFFLPFSIISLYSSLDLAKRSIRTSNTMKGPISLLLATLYVI
jgi:TRAP-type mannitol/chloroaromatic compound transport system permease small subunit